MHVPIRYSHVPLKVEALGEVEITILIIFSKLTQMMSVQLLSEGKIERKQKRMRNHALIIFVNVTLKKISLKEI